MKRNVNVSVDDDHRIHRDRWHPTFDRPRTKVQLSIRLCITLEKIDAIGSQFDLNVCVGIRICRSRDDPDDEDFAPAISWRSNVRDTGTDREFLTECVFPHHTVTVSWSDVDLHPEAIRAVRWYRRNIRDVRCVVSTITESHIFGDASVDHTENGTERSVVTASSNFGSMIDVRNFSRSD